MLLCSFTTTVGYGTLMLSANGGIRAFGLAALLGEIACITSHSDRGSGCTRALAAAKPRRAA